MMYSIPLQFFIQKLSTLLLALCHFVGLKGFGLILLKICCLILRLTTPIKKNFILGKRIKLTLSALISFGPEKHVGLNILGVSALIFLAVVY